MSEIDLKREVLSSMLDQGVAQAKSLLPSVNIDLIEKDREVLLDKLCQVCKSSGEDLLVVDEFIKSDLYEAYLESMAQMISVITEHLIGSSKKQTIH